MTLYDLSTQATAYLDRESVNAKKIIDKRYRYLITLNESLLNLQHSIAACHFWQLGAPMGFRNAPNKAPIISAFHKNIYAFWSALELTRKGIYGPARTLLRYIFEALIIAKFSSLNPKSGVVSKWLNGEDVFLARDIIGQIRSPDVSEIKIFWKLLCQYAHATKYAQQVGLDLSEVDKEVHLNLLFLRILSECNYHLLNSHLLNKSMLYYTNLYNKEANSKDKSVRIRNIFLESKKELRPSSKKLIREYVRKWVFKNQSVGSMPDNSLQPTPHMPRRG